MRIRFILKELNQFQMKKTGFCNDQVKRVRNSSEENLNEFLRYASQRNRTSQLIAIQDQEYKNGIARIRDQVVKFGNDFRVASEICLVWMLGDKPEKDKS